MSEIEKILKTKKKIIKKDRKKFKKWLKIGEKIIRGIEKESSSYNYYLNRATKSNEITYERLKPIPKEIMYKERKALKLIKIYLEDNLIPSEQSL